MDSQFDFEDDSFLTKMATLHQNFMEAKRKGELDLFKSSYDEFGNLILVGDK